MIRLLLPLVLIGACAGRRAAPDAPEAAPASSARATATAESADWTGAGAPTAAELAVAVEDTGGGTTAVELVCGAWRERASLRIDAAGIGGTAWFRGVPAADCTLFFKGGPPAQFAPVRGGDALRCRLVATTAVCLPVGP